MNYRVSTNSARAVSFLRGKTKDPSSLLVLLADPVPLPLDVKQAIVSGIRPLQRWLRFRSADVRGRSHGFYISLAARRGRPPAAVLDQDFIAAFGFPDGIALRKSIPSAGLSTQDINRHAFAEFIEWRIDADFALREVLRTAFSVTSRFKFKLEIRGHGVRGRGRPAIQEDTLRLDAMLARSRLDKRKTDLLTSPELVQEARRRRCSTETLLKRVYRYAPRKAKSK